MKNIHFFARKTRLNDARYLNVWVVALKKTSSYTSHSFVKLARTTIKPLEGNTMKWETPAYNDLRFGFEVTMYIYNR